MSRAVLSSIAFIVLVSVAPARAAGAATLEPSMKTIPPPALETLRRSLKEVTRLIPAPDKPYVLRGEETKLTVDPGAPWDAKSKAWPRPARATAEYTYDLPEGATGISDELRGFMGPIEVTVELNGEPRFADLASEGGPPTLIPVKGATAVEVAVIAPGAVQGRVAAMTPRQSEYRLAAITIFVADPGVEANIRSAVKAHTSPRAATAPTADPAELHVITVRIHGPKKSAEELARRIPAASLRPLLRR